MSENKLIAVRAKSGKKSAGVKYHTAEECRFVKSAKSVREPKEGELEWHDAEECSNCIRIKEKEE